MSDEYGSYEYLQILQEEGQEQPKLRKIHLADTGADTQRIENRWTGKVWFALYRNIQRTIPRKQLLARVLNMWRRHYGKVLFGSIVKHIVKLHNDIGNDA